MNPILLQLTVLRCTVHRNNRALGAEPTNTTNEGVDANRELNSDPVTRRPLTPTVVSLMLALTGSGSFLVLRSTAEKNVAFDSPLLDRTGTEVNKSESAGGFGFSSAQENCLFVISSF